MAQAFNVYCNGSCQLGHAWQKGMVLRKPAKHRRHQEPLGRDHGLEGRGREGG